MLTLTGGLKHKGTHTHANTYILTCAHRHTEMRTCALTRRRIDKSTLTHRCRKYSNKILPQAPPFVGSTPLALDHGYFHCQCDDIVHGKCSQEVSDTRPVVINVKSSDKVHRLSASMLACVGNICGSRPLVLTTDLLIRAPPVYTHHDKCFTSWRQ